MYGKQGKIRVDAEITTEQLRRAQILASIDGQAWADHDLDELPETTPSAILNHLAADYERENDPQAYGFSPTLETGNCFGIQTVIHEFSRDGLREWGVWPSGSMVIYFFEDDSRERLQMVGFVNEPVRQGGPWRYGVSHPDTENKSLFAYFGEREASQMAETLLNVMVLEPNGYEVGALYTLSQAGIYYSVLAKIRQMPGYMTPEEVADREERLRSEAAFERVRQALHADLTAFGAGELMGSGETYEDLGQTRPVAYLRISGANGHNVCVAFYADEDGTATLVPQDTHFS